MPYNCFTALELAAIASAFGAEKVYGLPDYFAGISQGEQNYLLQAATERLMEKQVLKMDFDGVVELAPDYRDIASVVFSCEKCLTVNLQDGRSGAKAFIFWKSTDRLVMAEAVENQYVLSFSDGDFLKALVSSFAYKDADELPGSFVIPGITLEKAKRACEEGRLDDAIRLIRQAGAHEKEAFMFAEALCCRADVLSVLLADAQNGDAITELTYFQTNRTLFRVGAKVVNLRSCAEIAGADAESAKTSIEQLVNSFLA